MSFAARCFWCLKPVDLHGAAIYDRQNGRDWVCDACLARFSSKADYALAICQHLERQSRCSSSSSDGCRGDGQGRDGGGAEGPR